MYRLVGRVPEGVRQPIVRVAKPSYTLGAMGILQRPDGHVLLVRHSYRTSWGLPGGLLDRHEQPAAALVRELREEVSLTVTVKTDPVTVVDPYRQRVDFVFVVDHDGDEPMASSAEIVDVRWFPASDLPDLQHEVAEAIVAVERFRRQGGGIHLMSRERP